MANFTSQSGSGSLAVDMYYDLVKKYESEGTKSNSSENLMTRFQENNSARVESIKMRRSNFSNYVNNSY